KEEKDVVDGKLARLLKSSKDLENIIELEKDLSWTGLPKFVDGTVTDYSRPLPNIVSTSAENQNKDTSTSEDVASTNPPKSFIKFVKPKDSQPESKSKEQETPKKSQVKKRVQRETNRSQNYSYKSSTHRSAGHKPNSAHMRPPLRSSGPRPHGDSMRPAGHRPHGPSMNPRRPTMNGARPYKS
nr:hypothetical protein [Tanacetum cinerariifolium]